MPCKPAQASESAGFFSHNAVSRGLPLRNMQNLILASTSIYRAEALSRLGLAFDIEASAVDETPLPAESPNDLAMRLAHAKAAAVAAKHADAVVIGADQVGELNGERLGKPGSSDAAVAQLQRLSGRQARFHSAVAVHDASTGKRFGTVVTTDLEFRTISATMAANYVAMDNPVDCAGAFKVESAGIALFKRVVSDDPSALIGLPMIALLDALAECGINPLLPP